MLLLTPDLCKTWGIEAINAERRYVRHIKFTGPGGEDIKVRLVYDYCGCAYFAMMTRSNCPAVGSL